MCFGHSSPTDFEQFKNTVSREAQNGGIYIIFSSNELRKRIPIDHKIRNKYILLLLFWNKHFYSQFLWFIKVRFIVYLSSGPEYFEHQQYVWFPLMFRKQWILLTWQIISLDREHLHQCLLILLLKLLGNFCHNCN